MSASDKPTVLIVGAGLGGLLLGALLEKSGVPYVMFERAADIKPLGSAMAVGPNLLPVFEQLGIYDEFLAISKPTNEVAYFTENWEAYKPADQRPIEELGGYGFRIVSRTMLHALFIKQVPAHKVHFGNRVLNVTEDNDKVTIHLSNNTTFVGDVVVGADGAYSAVRQRMYDQLKNKGELPRSDYEELPFSYTCLVGQTEALDPDEFPCIKDPFCQFNLVLALEQRFRNNENSEWGAYSTQVMCNETRDFPIHLGDGRKRTIGELYDKTPKEFISKVMLEEKVFDTWYSGRCVLLGDGGVTAMHDAIALANLLYALPSSSSSDITKIFEEYHAEQFPVVTYAFKSSQLACKMIGKGIVGSVALYIGTHMPMWLWKKVKNVKCNGGAVPSVTNDHEWDPQGCLVQGSDGA
ncbi:hypothetical protein BGW39_007752 [Mortierella sp. 14UC]|nr:hypothetical protein BGW39_007752 [Mortierella sp. 14UC]